MSTLLAASLSGAAHTDSAAIKQSPVKLGVQSTDIQPSPISGMSTVLTDSGALYVTDGGRRITQGPMYDVSGAQPVNVINQLLVGKLNTLSSEMIVCKTSKEQHVITVFTNIICGYYRELYGWTSSYNALGTTIHYLAFPHQGSQSQAKQGMKVIWRAEDRNKALDDAADGKGVQPVSRNASTARHYTFGAQMGVDGAPAMVLSNGMALPDYQGPKKLKAPLDEHKKQINGN